LLFAALVGASLDRSAVAAESFPVDEELLLDTQPMRGSKRVPMLDIKRGGVVLIDLWCNSVQAQFVVAANTLTVLTGPRTSNNCPPERQAADVEMLSALEQITGWRRDGNDIVLIGPKNLRFYRATN
jgi:hypothetical protein